LTALVKNDRGGRALGRKKEPGMNKAEARYAQQLELRKQVGEILWWAFEGMSFKIGERCYWTPDFDVMLASHELQVIDVKGKQTKIRKNGEAYTTDYTEDDARVKIAAVATMYPISVFIAYEGDEGNWITKEIGG
jgi:hypothetical protein